jgi:hypothetical protein
MSVVAGIVGQGGYAESSSGSSSSSSAYCSSISIRGSMNSSVFGTVYCL